MLHLSQLNHYFPRLTGGQDFDNAPLIMTFTEGQRMDCLDIRIFEDDMAHEKDERFMVQFTVLTPGVVTGEPNTSFVTIIDNDGTHTKLFWYSSSV